MLQLWKWIKTNPNRAMFLVPIILVAIISISHVVTWYDMANPIKWAIYLSIAIEMAAMTALVAVDSKVKGGIWFMFGIVTFIQIVGNVFYCFKEIDATGELFKSWVELTSPVWELMGTEVTDTIALKRWLAFLEGGLLPIISLTSLHFFITYNKEEKDNDPKVENYFDHRNKEIEKIVEERENNSNIDSPNSSIVEPPVEEESKAESVKATTPPTSGEENKEVEVMQSPKENRSTYIGRSGKEDTHIIKEKKK
jgi:hypothetical protein